MALLSFLGPGASQTQRHEQESGQGLVLARNSLIVRTLCKERLTDSVAFLKRRRCSGGRAFREHGDPVFDTDLLFLDNP